MTQQLTIQLASAVRRMFEIHDESYVKGGQLQGHPLPGRYGKDLEQSAWDALTEVGLPQCWWQVLVLAAHWDNDLIDWSNNPDDYCVSPEVLRRAGEESARREEGG